MRILTCTGRATFYLGDFEAVLEAISSGTSHLTLRRELLGARTLTLCVGKMKPEGMITKTIKLNEVVEEGFNTLINDKENHVKILVDVGAGI